MKKYLNTIINSDVLEGLDKLEDDSVSLTFTSPPYNVDIQYGNHKDNMPYSVYLEWLEKIFTKVYNKTRVGGRCAINIDAMTNRQEDKDQEYVRCIYAHLYEVMKKIGWKFRTEICWYKQNAVGKKTAFGSYMSCSNPVIRRNHEYILVWSKGNWTLEGDSELSDMTPKEFNDWTFSTWFISPETKSKGGHPVPFPLELATRVVKLFSYREDLILDPFSGSGTTAYVANKFGRKYIGIDIDPDYVKYSIDRIEKYNNKAFEEEYIPRSKRLENNKKKPIKKEILID